MNTENLIPKSLLSAYWDDSIVFQCFDHAHHAGLSREAALINCVKALLKQKEILVKDTETLRNVRFMLSVTDMGNYIPRLEILKKVAGV